MYKQKRGEISPRFCYASYVLCKLVSIKISENLNVYAGFVDFCPIIPFSSILLTIPVGFIVYLSPLQTRSGGVSPPVGRETRPLQLFYKLRC